MRPRLNLITTNANRTPTGIADTYATINGGYELSVDLYSGVLANDSDQDGQQVLTAVGLDSSATAGSVVLSNNGSFEYVAPTDFVGTDTFTYRVSDSLSVSEPVTVSIEVGQAARPSFLPYDAWVYSASEQRDTNYGNDGALEVSGSSKQTYLRFDLSELQGQVYEAELEMQAFSVTNSSVTHYLREITNDSWNEETLTWNNKPTYAGTVKTWTPSASQNSTIDLTDYVLAALAAGDKQLSFAITGTGSSTVKYASSEHPDVSLRPRLNLVTTDANRTPTGIADSYDTINGGYELSIDLHSGVLANDSDEDGQQVLTAVGLDTSATAGSVVFTNNGAFEYIAPTDFVGIDTFTYRVSDALDVSEPVTVSILVAQVVSPNFSPADSWVYNHGDHQDSNFGSSETLEVYSSSKQTYLRFDLSNLHGQAYKAKLQLHPISITNASVTHYLREVSDDTWEQETLTWNNKPAYGNPVATWTPVEGQPSSIDMTQYVLAALAAGETQLSFAITGSGTSTVKYASSENAVDSHRPILNLSGNFIDPPTITEIDDLILEVPQSDTLPFFIGDADTPADQLVLSFSSSDPEIIPESADHIVLTGTGTDRNVQIIDNGVMGTSTITLTVTDLDGGVATTSFDVIRREPLPQGMDETFETPEDTPFEFQQSNFTYSDLANAPFHSVIIESVANDLNGSLTFDDPVQGVIDLGSTPLPKTIEIGDLNRLVFTPAQDFFGDDLSIFSFRVSASDRESAEIYSMSANVESVNDAPTSSNQQLSIEAAQTHVFDSSDLTYEDVESDELTSVTISNIQIESGTLLFDGSDVPTTAIPISDLDKLTFTAPEILPEDNLGTFEFAVSDGMDASQLYQFTLIPSPFQTKILNSQQDTDVSEEDYGAPRVTGWRDQVRASKHEDGKSTIYFRFDLPAEISELNSADFSFQVLGGSNVTGIVLSRVTDDWDEINFTDNDAQLDPIGDSLQFSVSSSNLARVTVDVVDVVTSALASSPELDSIAFRIDATGSYRWNRPLNLSIASREHSELSYRPELKVNGVFSRAGIAPSISEIEDISLPGNISDPLSFSIGDSEDQYDELAITFASSNHDLVVPEEDFIQVTGEGAHREVQVFTNPNSYGQAIVTLTITDTDGDSTDESFSVFRRPPAPAGFTATRITHESLLLSWQQQPQEVEYYNLYRSTDQTDWELLVSVDGDSSEYRDLSVVEDTRYYYAIDAYDVHGLSERSDPLRVYVKPNPADQLDATFLSSTQVQVTWRDLARLENEFRVEWSTDGGANWTLAPETVDEGINLYVVNHDFEPNHEYRFRVRTYGGGIPTYLYSTSEPVTIVSPSFPAKPEPPGHRLESGAVVLTWNGRDDGTTSFQLQRRESYGDSQWAEIAQTDAQVTTFVDQNVIEDTSYDYRLLASNGTWYSPPSEHSRIRTTVLAPTGLVAQHREQDNRILMTWVNESSIDVRFMVEYSENGGESWRKVDTAIPSPLDRYEPVTASFVTAENVERQLSEGPFEPGREYLFRVRAFKARDAENWLSRNQISSISESISTTIPAVPWQPSGLTAVGDDSSIQLGWLPIRNANTVEVQRVGANGAWQTIANLDAEIREYTDTGLQPGNQRTYRLLAQNTIGASSPSVSATGWILPNPVINLDVEYQDVSKIEVSWTDNAQVSTQYEIQRSEDWGWTWQPIRSINSDDSGEYNVTVYRTYELGSNYSFRVVSSYETPSPYRTVPLKHAAYSETLETTAPDSFPDDPDEPAVPKPTHLATTVTVDSVHLPWRSTAEVATFEVQRRVGSEDWQTWHTTDVNVKEFRDENLDEGQTYSYRIYARNEDGVSDPSTTRNATTLLISPENLTINRITATVAEVEWTEVSEVANNYSIEISTNGQSYRSLMTVVSGKETENIGSSYIPGQTYWFRIFAGSSRSQSTTPAVASFTTAEFPSKPSRPSASSTSESVVLTWPSLDTNVSRLVIQRKIGSGSWSEIASIESPTPDTTSFTDNNVDEGTNYSYRLIAQNEHGSSQASDPVVIYTLPIAPSNLSVTVVSSTQFHVSWSDNSEREPNYKLDYSRDGGDTWFHIKTTERDVEWASIQRELNGNHEYFVRARAGNSEYANTSFVTPAFPDKPAGLVATERNTNSLRLAWEDQPDREIDSYTLERSSDRSDWAVVAVLTDQTEYFDNSLQDNHKYHYRLFATNSIGDSPYSTVTSANTILIPAGSVSASVIHAGRINLSWANRTSSSDVYHRVERFSDEGNWEAVSGGLSGGVQNFSYLSSLQGGKEYRFRVLSQSDFWEEDPVYSEVASVTTAAFPDAPQITGNTSTTETVTLSWTSEGLDSHYLVERGIGDNWDEIGQTQIAETTFVDLTALEGVRYNYRVTAVNSHGQSEPSQPVSAFRELYQPHSLTSSNESRARLDLQWSDSSTTSDFYLVQQSTDNGQTWQSISDELELSNRQFTVRQVFEPGLQYTFRIVSSHILADDLLASDPLTITTPFLPAQPDGLSIEAIGGTLKVDWIDVEDETSYQLQRKTADTDWSVVANLGENVVTYTDTNSDTSVATLYRVLASNSLGDSIVSRAVFWGDDQDTDQDGLPDQQEHLLGTSPYLLDTDGDLLFDGFEIAASNQVLNPLLHNDVSLDLDVDGLNSIQEQIFKTNAGNADSDSDSVKDGVETQQASNPNDGSDLGIAPEREDLVAIDVKIYDPSLYAAEYYGLQIGDIFHQEEAFNHIGVGHFGVPLRQVPPTTTTYYIPADRPTYVGISHLGTNELFFNRYGFSDFDWQANVDLAPEEDGILLIEDPARLLGRAASSAPPAGRIQYSPPHGDDDDYCPVTQREDLNPQDPFPPGPGDDPEGPIVLRVPTPKLDLEGRDWVWRNVNDDDQDEIVDLEDSIVDGGDDDLEPVRLTGSDDSLVATLDGSIRLFFDSSEIKV
ncbi:MAG: fibronectin type III domain-containing protein [Planctomycetota bacterium]